MRAAGLTTGVGTGAGWISLRPSPLPSDASIERAIERLVMPLHAAVAAGLGRMGSAARRLAQRSEP